MNDDRMDIDVGMGETWLRRQDAEIAAARKRRAREQRELDDRADERDELARQRDADADADADGDA